MAIVQGATQMSITDELANDPSLAIAATEGSELERSRLNPLVGHVQTKYDMFKRDRHSHEVRWINAFSNFRGQPIDNKSFIETEVSKAFIKITKTKVIAAYGQLCEVVFANNVLPIEIVASVEVKDAPEYAHIDMDDPAAAGGEDQGPQLGSVPHEAVLGFPGDGNDLKPGETIQQRVLVWIKDKFGKNVKVKPGPGDKPGRITLKPAEMAALRMNKRVRDQLEDCQASTAVRQSLFEMVMLGSGVLKGPFVTSKEYPEWDENGEYSPHLEDMPILKHVRIWDFFPNLNQNFQNLNEAIERHKMDRSQLRALKRNVSFIPEAIDRVIENMPNYVREYYETSIEESNSSTTPDHYEVLEYWGKIDKKLVDDLGINLGFSWPDGVDELDCNIWTCCGEYIRFVMNPFTPTRFPYYICPYEFNPYSVFGVGVPENMEDTQMLMNGFMRLAVDNAVLSGSVMLEVDESVMSPGQEYAVETSKIWRKNATTQQAAIRPIQIPNTAQANMQMFDAARRLADEATGIPSFSHGMTGVQGTGRTSSGISMLLGAASLSTKTVVKNTDDYWFMPIGQAYYHWNMQYKFDPSLRGDLSAIAKGTSNFMQRDMKFQKLMQFGQVAASNPNTAAWVRWNDWIKQVGQIMEVDTETLLNRPDEAMLQMKLMAMLGQSQQQQAQAPLDASNPAGGVPPQPGQPTFTGNAQTQQPMSQGAQNVGQSPDAGVGQEGGSGGMQ